MTAHRSKLALIRRSAALCALLCSLTLISPPARALPFVKVGPTVGYGVGLIDQAEDLNQSLTTVVVGASALLDIPVVKVEVDLLYLMRTYETESTLAQDFNLKTESTLSFISVPVIVRYNLSPIPLFDLGIGGGYERRFAMGDDAGDNSERSFLPLSARADFKVPLLASLGVEARFAYDLSDLAEHDLMLLAHVAF